MEFYGIYPGIVVSVDGHTNSDDLKTTEITTYMSRIRVRVVGVDPPNVSEGNLPDAIVAYSIAGDGFGEFSPLYPGDTVLVSFINGDPSLRCIIGRYYASDRMPTDMQSNYPMREGFVSRYGHGLFFDNPVQENNAAEDDRSGVYLCSMLGQTILLRDKWGDIQLRTKLGARLSIRASKSDSGSIYDAIKGILFESASDDNDKKYIVKIDEENEQIEVLSKEGYKITIRDIDQSSGSEKKGITLKTKNGRSIVLDEESGKLLINHDGEAIISASKVIIDSDLDVNGKIESTGDIETTGGKIKAADTIEDVLGDLTTHLHGGVTPGSGNTAPRA